VKLLLALIIIVACLVLFNAVFAKSKASAAAAPAAVK